MSWGYRGNVTVPISLERATKLIRKAGIDARRSDGAYDWDRVDTIPITAYEYEYYDNERLMGIEVGSKTRSAIKENYGYLKVQNTVNFVGSKPYMLVGTQPDIKIKCRIHDVGTLRRLAWEAKTGGSTNIFSKPGESPLNRLIRNEQEVYISFRSESRRYKKWSDMIMELMNEI